MAEEKPEQCTACNVKRGQIADLKQRLAALSPHLLDYERDRARATWEAAYFAYSQSEPHQPGPWAVIAAVLADAEKVTIVVGEDGSVTVKGRKIDMDDPDGRSVTKKDADGYVTWSIGK